MSYCDCHVSRGVSQPFFEARPSSSIHTIIVKDLHILDSHEQLSLTASFYTYRSSYYLLLAIPTMPTSTFQSTTPNLEFKSYSEDENSKAQGKPEPNSRSQTIVYHVNDEKWWIKVTLHGTFPPFNDQMEPGQHKSKRERREEFQKFIKVLDFRSQSLLNDTVTELIHHPKYNNQSTSFQNLQFHTREDPSRVVYPSILEFPFFRTINVEELTQKYEISDGVFHVSHDKKTYILKIINRPLYNPQDTTIIKQELKNLQLFKNIPGIVQPAGIATFPNPYTTNLSKNPDLVINGILLEYYTGDTLQKILDERQIQEHCS